jgi:hypothetical protein
VSAALRALQVKEIVLDGEAMARCKAGLPDFLRPALGRRRGCGLSVRLRPAAHRWRGPSALTA